MRVVLFTDTLYDVNGVSRFILNIAELARTAGGGRELHVLTSTRFPPPPGFTEAQEGGEGGSGGVHNLPPPLAAKMPGYPNLEVVWPPHRALVDLARRLRPDVVHVSTPGPVGAVGRRFARRHGLPLLGTYHTDFPAYVDHLFDDPALTWITTQAMRRFYRPFARIFTRSADYARALVRLGFPHANIVPLLPGIRTDVFHIDHRPPDTRAFWSAYPGVDPDAVKVLYVGRVSVEKNLPLLARIWKSLAASPGPTPGPRAQLIVVGDGPYRQTMQRELAGAPAVFLGFRHGPELSAIYAASDLFVFPSTTDTLGQVVMEAQSAGLPVIVTDQGGPSEVVSSTPGDGQTGYVLPARDTHLWVSTLRRLIADPDLRRRLGNAAHRAMQAFSIRASFDHFWRIHEQAAEAPPSPAPIPAPPIPASPSLVSHAAMHGNQ